MPEIPWIPFLASPSETTFAPLFESSREQIYSICALILKNHDDAADAFQATYSRLILLAQGNDPSLANFAPENLLRRLAVREAHNLACAAIAATEGKLPWTSRRKQQPPLPARMQPTCNASFVPPWSN